MPCPGTRHRLPLLRRGPPLPALPWRARWLRESPLVLGVALGAFLLCSRGGGFQPLEVPVGPDWHQYFMAAWKVLGAQPQDYPAFRLPLFPWVLGSLGGRVGYATAALHLSSVAMLLVVILAGWVARRLAGPWAGCAAALSVPLVATNAEAARWASQYPFFAAVAGLALAGAVTFSRTPRWGWAGLAGAAAGLTWAVDNRGTVVVVAVVGLVLLGLTRPAGGRARLAGAVAFVGAAALGPLLQGLLQVVPRPASAWLLDFQRGQSMADIQNLQVPGLVADCSMDFIQEAGLLEAWRHPCGQALLRDNLGDLAPELPAGALLTLVALPLVLLPGRHGWRGSAASGLVFGPVFVAITYAATLIDLPPRYYVPFAVPMAALVPVGLARLGHALPRPWGGPASAVACVILSGWLLGGGPSTGRPLAASPHLGPVKRVQAGLLPVIRARLGPGDLLLDCSHNLRLQVAMLPDHHHPDPGALREAPDPHQCLAWVLAPAGGGGGRWLVTDEDWRGPDPAGAGWAAVAQAHHERHLGILWQRGSAAVPVVTAPAAAPAVDLQPTTPAPQPPRSGR